MAEDSESYGESGETTDGTTNERVSESEETSDFHGRRMGIQDQMSAELKRGRDKLQDANATKSFEQFARQLALTKKPKDLDAAFNYILKNRKELGEGFVKEGLMMIFAKNSTRYLEKTLDQFRSKMWIGEVLWFSFKKNAFYTLKMVSPIASPPTGDDIPSSIEDFLRRVASYDPMAILAYDGMGYYYGCTPLNPVFEQIALLVLAKKQGTPFYDRESKRNHRERRKRFERMERQAKRHAGDEPSKFKKRLDVWAEGMRGPR